MTTSPFGCEQQTRALPTAGFSNRWGQVLCCVSGPAKQKDLATYIATAFILHGLVARAGFETYLTKPIRIPLR